MTRRAPTADRPIGGGRVGRPVRSDGRPRRGPGPRRPAAGPSEAGVRFLTPFRPGFVLAATTGRSPGRGEDAAGKTPYLGDAIPIW
jgi:hypothetical protein